MKEYILFLDECKPVPQNANPYFCFAGCIIEKEIYETNVCKEIKQLKKDIFNDESIVLHSYDIKKSAKQFTMLKDSAIRTEFWNKLKGIIQKNPITFISSYYDVNKYEQMYIKEYLHDPYYMTLQNIIENFVCFLQENNGVGQIFVEGRTPQENKKVNGYYYKILANGTPHITKYGLQQYLLSIAFLPKTDNNIGLQIADFVPSTLMRKIQGKADKFGLDKDIVPKLYKGKINDIDKYGLVDILR